MEKGILCVLSLLTLLLTGCGRNGRPQASDVTPQAKPTPIETEPGAALPEVTLEELYASSGGDLKVIYDPATDIPREISGRLSEETVGSERDALRLLMSLRSVFRIPEDGSFAFTALKEDWADLKAYELTQLYKGVPVDGGGFSVFVTLDGAPVSIVGSFLEVGELETEPAVTAEEGRRAIPSDGDTRIASVSLTLRLTADGSVRLCWKYVAFTCNYYVDAVTGDLLERVATVIY